MRVTSQTKDVYLFDDNNYNLIVKFLT